MTRRSWLAAGVATLVLAACGVHDAATEAAAREPTAPVTPNEPTPDVDLASVDWSTVLTSEEHHVLREAGTERAFTGDLWDHKGDGVYVCAACGQPLFDSSTKFKSGTGWPSFYAPIRESAVDDVVDTKFGMVRTETVCGRCQSHLGHVFSDGPPPTGQRYCMNSVSLDFVARDRVAELGDPAPIRLGGWD